MTTNVDTPPNPEEIVRQRVDELLAIGQNLKDEIDAYLQGPKVDEDAEPQYDDENRQLHPDGPTEELTNQCHDALRLIEEAEGFLADVQSDLRRGADFADNMAKAESRMSMAADESEEARGTKWDDNSERN